jgi:hypothetical protein
MERTELPNFSTQDYIIKWRILQIATRQRRERRRVYDNHIGQDAAHLEYRHG